MVGGEHPTFHIQHSTVTLNIPHSKKDSFWVAKGLLLVCKRTRFGEQKDSFWKAKGVLFLNVEC